MKPSGEGGLSAKGADLAIELNEDFLRHILRVRRISKHPQAERVNSPPVHLIQLLKCYNIACRRPSH
jgi:hypothetical protein